MKQTTAILVLLTFGYIGVIQSHNPLKEGFTPLTDPEPTTIERCITFASDKLNSILFYFKLKKYSIKRQLKPGEHCAAFGRFSYRFDITTRAWGDDTVYRVGNFCSISNHLTLILGGNHRYDWISTFPFPALGSFPNVEHIKDHVASKGDINIGNDVWIGTEVTILSGVTIGDGAVVGARSVVASDVAPYTIVVGNPARPVKKRFDEQTIQKLLQIQWWNWPLEKIIRNAPLLCSNNLHEFITKNS